MFMMADENYIRLSPPSVVAQSEFWAVLLDLCLRAFMMKRVKTIIRHGIISQNFGLDINYGAQWFKLPTHCPSALSTNQFKFLTLEHDIKSNIECNISHVKKVLSGKFFHRKA